MSDLEKVVRMLELETRANFREDNTHELEKEDANLTAFVLFY